MILIHDNGGRPYKIDILDEKTVKIYKLINENEYILSIEFLNVKNIFKGIDVSVLLELDEPKLANDEGLKTIIHISGSCVIQYYLNCNIEIKNYYAIIAGADVVYAYFETENNQLFVFDDDLLVHLKNPPIDIIGSNKFWDWYYNNYAIYMPSYVHDECMYDWY